jgi:ketosteroid isomerase-like protein
MHELASGNMLTRDLMLWFWQCYLAKPEDAANPLASPLREPDLAGLPPATILTAEFDPLRDEGELYADRLRAAGVSVVARMYPGMIHDFPQMPLVTEVAERALVDLAQDLRAALTSGARPSAAADHIATAKALYDAVMAQDWPTVERLVTEDFTIVESPSLPFAGTYGGRDAFQKLFGAISAQLTMKSVSVHDRIGGGDRVVVFATLVVDREGRDEALEIVEVVTFRGDRICRVEPYYYDHDLVRACAKAR